MTESIIDPTMTGWAFICIAMALAALRGMAVDRGAMKVVAFFSLLALAPQGMQALFNITGGASVTDLVGWSLAALALFASLLRAGTWLGT